MTASAALRPRHFSGRIVPVLLGAAGVACRADPETEPSGPRPSVVVRGDVVVVERAAAEFFQARVLSVAGAELKVQTTDDGEPVVVASSDAYPLPREPAALRPGDYAICSDRPNHWGPCRLGAPAGALVKVKFGSGEETSVAADRIIRANAVTALNIRRRFESVETRQRFSADALAAGSPPRPRGWLPEPREPVVARRRSGWYSAHVASLDDDGGVRVVWDGDGRSEFIPLDSVVPVPPSTHPLSRGGFALSRPAAAGESWRPVRIEALGPEEAVVAGPDGDRRRVGIREMVPLVPDPRP